MVPEPGVRQKFKKKAVQKQILVSRSSHPVIDTGDTKERFSQRGEADTFVRKWGKAPKTLIQGWGWGGGKPRVTKADFQTLRGRLITGIHVSKRKRKFCHAFQKKKNGKVWVGGGAIVRTHDKDETRVRP